MRLVLADVFEYNFIFQMRLRLRNIIKHIITCRSKSATIGKVGLLLSGGLNSRVIGNVLRDSQVRLIDTHQQVFQNIVRWQKVLWEL